ncbi:MAG TPA: glycosyltransferase family 2 protein [Candidatus Methylomirabilis sp.]|jgi:GT2 family glycosyltransferase
MRDTTMVIVSYNTRELTLRAAAAARAAARGLDAALVVADNGSTDGTPEAVRAAFPDAVVQVYGDNPGYGAALNRAFAWVPGAYLCALNADVLLDLESLRILRAYLADHPGCALAGPSLTGRDGKPQPSCKRFPTVGFAMAELFALHALAPRNQWNRRFYYGDKDLSRPARVETVSGAAILIRGDAFRRIGGFDEGFRMYFEETDLCRRLRRAGYDVAFVPEAKAVHWHGASTIQTSVRQVEYYLSYIRFVRKHRGPGPARALVAVVAVSTAARMLALPLKYPPLSRRHLAVLRPKLAACRRLLGRLSGSTALHAPSEVAP